MNINIKREHLEFLFLQRTRLDFENSLTVDSPEESISKAVTEMANADLNVFVEQLPKKINSILDIGCGLGIIDIAIHQHYKGEIDFHMFDRSDITDETVKKCVGGFHGPRGFNSLNQLNTTKDNLVHNGIPANNIYLIEANSPNDLTVLKNIDMVISLLSWGWHYPIEDYLEQVYDLMSSKGILIIDVRHNTDGRENLEKKFENIIVLDNPSERQKGSRIVCQK